MLLRFGLRVGVLLLHLFRQGGDYLFQQSLRKIGSRSETIVRLFGQGFQQDSLHVIRQLHLLSLQNEVLFPRLLYGIGHQLLVAIGSRQIHFPRRLAENQEIEQRTRGEDVAFHRIHRAESLGCAEKRLQVLNGESRATFHHVRNVPQVDDGGHQHTVLKFLEHDV